MICPLCKEQGLKSTIEISGLYATTGLASRTYYDEDGQLHHHDPNRSSGRMRCSKGHELAHIFQPGCEVEGCDFVGYERVEVRPPSLDEGLTPH